MLHAMFPRRIHAVTQEGFAIKVLSFVLAHNLKLLTQEMAQVATWVNVVFLSPHFPPTSGRFVCVCVKRDTTCWAWPMPNTTRCAPS